MKKLPSIVITGASGFIGSYIIDFIKDDFIVFAIARRARKEANIPFHPNLYWLQCDISNSATLDEAANYIINNGGADFLIHLAAFYDFTYKDNPAYKIVNVNGTKNILDFSLKIGIRRFIFASSIAACKFPLKGQSITENTLPDANYSYAISKKLGEELVKQYANKFSCSIVRFAAVYSDWCEFAPLYKFLSVWLSKNFQSRFIAGKGESAIPYIHIRDLCLMIRIILDKSEFLPEFDIYNASPYGSTSHKRIFEISTLYYFGKNISPLYIPKILAYPALIIKNILRLFHIVNKDSFERFWMIHYIDEKLNVNSSYTNSALEWKTTPRYHIERRLLFLLEKLKSHADEWHVKNEAVLRRFANRNNLMIYEKMIEQKETILSMVSERIIIEDKKGMYFQYKKMSDENFKCYLSAIYHLLLAAIRSSDRSLFLKYIDEIAIRRFAEGFETSVLCGTLNVFNDVIVKNLSCFKGLNKIKQEIYDNVGLTLQIAQDEIEDLYDNLTKKVPGEIFAQYYSKKDCKELQKLIHQLSAFYQIAPEDFNLTSSELVNNLR